MSQKQLSTYKLARDYCRLLKHGAISPGSFDDRDTFPGDPDYDAYTAYIDGRAARDGLTVETWVYFHHVTCVVASAVLRPDGTSYERTLLRQWQDSTAANAITKDWGNTIVRARRNARDRLRRAKP